MALRIGINGFGRIGRIILRQLQNYQPPTNTMNPVPPEIVGINDIAPVATLAHLLEFDSTHGHFPGKVSHTEKAIAVDGKEIPIFNSREPAKIPWKEVGADVVLECSGIFTDKAGASGHLHAGAKKVIISAPAKDPDATFVFGVNHLSYDPEKHAVVSNASCTTNCLAPVAYVLHKKFGLEQGFMTTIHSYTNDQKILDAPHKDLRRARSGAANQIPTTTGAAKAVGLVLPDLAGKLDGFAIRVPTANVSCTDLVATLSREVTAEVVNAALREAAQGELKGILGYEGRELVSSDFLGDRRSSIVDAPCTKAKGRLAKVLAWYDNETGFSCRMLDLAAHIGT